MVLNVWAMVPAVAPGDCSVVFAVTLKEKQVLKETPQGEFLKLKFAFDLICCCQIVLIEL